MDESAAHGRALLEHLGGGGFHTVLKVFWSLTCYLHTFNFYLQRGFGQEPSDSGPSPPCITTTPKKILYSSMKRLTGADLSSAPRVTTKCVLTPGACDFS